jgi:hypothetical protein
MDPQQTLALALGVGWASGLNLYAAVFVLGALNALGFAALPPDLQVLSHPTVLFAAGAMYVVEFFADKVPGLDSVWDALHTFIRIPAGAILAAQAVGHIHPALSVAAALVGGSLAAGSHFTKAGTRALVNTSPEPFSNWTLSFSEDLLVIGGLWTALHHPWIFLAMLVVIVAVMAAVLPLLVKALGRVWSWLFRRKQLSTPMPPAVTAV